MNQYLNNKFLHSSQGEGLAPASVPTDPALPLHARDDGRSWVVLKEP